MLHLPSPALVRNSFPKRHTQRSTTVWRSHWCHSLRSCLCQRAWVLANFANSTAEPEGMQLQFRKVDNVEEEGNRYFNDAREGKGFESGGMYNKQMTRNESYEKVSYKGNRFSPTYLFLHRYSSETDSNLSGSDMIFLTWFSGWIPSMSDSKDAQFQVKAFSSRQYKLCAFKNSLCQFIPDHTGAMILSSSDCALTDASDEESGVEHHASWLYSL